MCIQNKMGAGFAWRIWKRLSQSNQLNREALQLNNYRKRKGFARNHESIQSMLQIFCLLQRDESRLGNLLVLVRFHA